jgi:hypothetical protein
MYGAGMGPELFKWLRLNLTSLQIIIGLGVTRVTEVREKSGKAT